MPVARAGALACALALCCLAAPPSVASVSAPAAAASAAGQLAPRATGARVAEAVDAAAADIATRAAATHDAPLAAVARQLSGMASALRDNLGSDIRQPVEIMDDKPRGRSLRAQAAAARARAYLAASAHCLGDDKAAMTAALAGMVARLAAAEPSSKSAQPVITGVETLDRRPLFVIHGDSGGQAFALTGSNLLDARCPGPTVTATDSHGVALATQPVITGVSPNRIELKLAQAADLPAGAYVLHVVPQHKAFLLGCSRQPEAVATLQVAAPARFSVDYRLVATCRADDGSTTAAAPVTGTLAGTLGAGAALSRQLEVPACADPVSYALSASATFGDGPARTVGPLQQSASAGITVGLPGGLMLSWNPSVRQLFVRPAAQTCKGVY